MSFLGIAPASDADASWYGLSSRDASLFGAVTRLLVDGRSGDRSQGAGTNRHPDTPTRRVAIVDALGGIAVPELLAQVHDGSHAAFTILCRELFSMLWRVAVNEVHRGDVAEDIVQDVLVWLWTRRTMLDVTLDIRVYLVVAVRNRARDLGKHGRVANAVAHAVEQAEAAVPALGQPAPSADQALEAHEFRAAYQRALALLNDRERVAVLLRWEEGWPFARIAQALSLSDVGTRKLILRAQAKVQTALRDFR